MKGVTWEQAWPKCWGSRVWWGSGLALSDYQDPERGQGSIPEEISSSEKKKQIQRKSNLFILILYIVSLETDWE